MPVMFRWTIESVHRTKRLDDVTIQPCLKFLDRMDISSAIRATAEFARPATRRGRVADYIPQLAEVDPKRFGLAGGIMAAAPDHSGICAWSPPLDQAGNSLAGRVALHDLIDRLELSIF